LKVPAKDVSENIKLGFLLVWWAKNLPNRTVEIANILGNLSEPLATVQSLDSNVLKKINFRKLLLKKHSFTE
jgi:hypothetical protein